MKMNTPTCWRRTAVLGLVLAALPHLAGAQAPAAPSREQIRSFDSTITVRKDASLLVEEKIAVRALGIAIQHGICREFVAHDGRAPLAIRVTAVQLDGNPAPFEIRQQNDATRLCLGDPETPLVTGDHEFSVTYATPALVAETNGRDRLDWNVTGNSWQFPITDITARVQLPEGVPQDAITVEGYTGGFGATGKNYMFDLDTQGTVTFTAGPLARNQGLTVAVEFPAGHIRHGWNVPLFLLEHSGLATALVGLFVLLLYWTVSWFYFGKDPAAGPVIARTAPPQEVSAAGMRYLTRMAFDTKTFATAVVSLARRGVLSIDEAADDCVLTRTHADYDQLALEERVLAKTLFGGGQAVSLKRNARRVREALTAFRKAMQQEYTKYFASNAQFTPPALVISSVAALVSLYFELGARLREDGPTALIVLIVAITCGAVLYRLWPLSLREWKRPAQASFSAAGLGPERRNMFVVVALGIVLLVLWAALAESVSWTWAVMLLLYAAANVAFTQLIKAPTPQGRRVLDEIAGFRIYLRRVSATLAAGTEEDAEAVATFQRYLACAMALDMDSDWGRRFHSALQQDSERAACYVPHWYRGDNFDGFFFRQSYFGASDSRSPESRVPQSSASGRGA